MALSAPVLQHFADHLGIASVDELLALGVTPDQLSGAVARGQLVRVHDGVSRVASAPLSFESRCRAASLAHPGVVVAGVSAGRLWGLRRLPSRAPLQLAVPPSSRPIRAADVRLYCTNGLRDDDIVVRPDGIRVLSPPRTTFDLARLLSDDDLESVIEQVLDRYCSPPTLWALARRVGKRGRPGTARYRRVLFRRPAWQRPMDSDLEVRVLRALRQRGIELQPQFPLLLPNGELIHLDGADPAIRWGLEIDHLTWHGGRLDAQADKGRDRGARRIGWQIERVTDREVDDRLDELADELAVLYRLRQEDILRRRRSA